MFQSQKGLLHRGIQSCDFLIVGLATCISSLNPLIEAATPPTLLTIVLQSLVISVIWFVAAYQKRFYQSRRTESPSQEFKQIIELSLIGISAGTLAVLVSWKQLTFHPLTALALTIAGISSVRIIVRLVLRKVRQRGMNYRRVVIVGNGHAGTKMAANFNKNPHYGVRLLGAFHLQGEDSRTTQDAPDLGEASKLGDYLLNENVDAVVLCPSRKADMAATEDLLQQCDEIGVECYYTPSLMSLKNLEATTGGFCDTPTFTFQPSIGSPLQLRLKRAMDITGALVGLTLTAPLFLLIAASIKLHDRGPVFFRQVRLGKDGKRFRCFKFRSMSVNAEAQKAALMSQNQEDGPAFKIKADPRVTKTGKLLRKYSLDELPQLINVLTGDMSIVGPRPPIPAEVSQYDYWQRRRICVRPGLTCVWQVQGRNRVSFDEWMKMDLFYIDNWSIWMDIKLICQTVPAVTRGTGA